MLNKLNEILNGKVTKKQAEMNGFIVSDFAQTTSSGHKIRTATQVQLPNGKTIRFTGKMGVKLALNNVKFQLERS